MAQASNNQMYLLKWLGIELPKPQTVRGVTWKVKRKWSERTVAAILEYVGRGNGAGPGDNAYERLVLYRMARRLYEGRYVTKIHGEDERQYLVLQISPKSEWRVWREAETEGISPEAVDPFECDFVLRGEPPDYEGHIRGPADISDYRLVEPAEAVIAAASETFRQPKLIAGDLFPLVMTWDTLAACIRGFTEGELFRDGDCLPSPSDVAAYQKLRYGQRALECPNSVNGFKPLSAPEVADVYRRSHYVKQEGSQYLIIARSKVVCV